jgi:purine-nucleoside phosphorylase
VALKKGKEVTTDEATHNNHNNGTSSTMDSTVPTDDKDIHDQLSEVAPPSLEFDHGSGLLLCKDYFPDKTLQWTINLRGFATDAISRGRTMVNDMSLDDLLMATEATIDSKLSAPWWESGHGAKH